MCDSDTAYEQLHSSPSDREKKTNKKRYTINAVNFQEACLPNNPDRTEQLRAKFEAKFNKYKMSLDSSSLDPKLNWISVELVDNIIRAMQLGKAAGVDGV